MTVASDVLTAGFNMLLDLAGVSMTYTNTEVDPHTTQAITMVQREQVGFVDEKARKVFEFETADLTTASACVRGHTITDTDSVVWTIIDVKQKNTIVTQIRAEAPVARN